MSIVKQKLYFKINDPDQKDKKQRVLYLNHILIYHMAIFILLLSVHIITIDNFISAQKNAFHS